MSDIQKEMVCSTCGQPPHWCHCGGSDEVFALRATIEGLRAECESWKIMADRMRDRAESARAAAFREAAEVARKHGEFCHNEAHHGGSHDLYERARGATYIAARLTAKAKEDTQP